jgi:DNA-binding NarL/FixJ family response regulator
MIRILLVDDQSLIRQALSTLLNLEPDLEIVGTAENGEAAIVQYAELKPDVVLMDMRMPIMNGCQATASICRQYPQANILILSTHDDGDDVINALQAGAKGYLLKDMLSDELAQAIRNIHQGYTQLAPGLIDRFIHRSPDASATIPKTSQITAMGVLPMGNLTPKELEVTRLIGSGASNQEIAQQLFIAESTVKTHVNSIFNRLGLKNRSQLAIYAHRHLLDCG